MLRLNVFMELKLTSIGRLFQTLTTLSQKKVQRFPVLCGLKTLYIFIYDNTLRKLIANHRRRLFIFFLGCKFLISIFLSCLCSFLSIFHALPCRDMLPLDPFRGSGGALRTHQRGPRRSPDRKCILRAFDLKRLC